MENTDARETAEFAIRSAMIEHYGKDIEVIVPAILNELLSTKFSWAIRELLGIVLTKQYVGARLK